MGAMHFGSAGGEARAFLFWIGKGLLTMLGYQPKVSAPVF